MTVAHKPIAIPKVVRTRARGLDRDTPHGVRQRLQVTSHKAEPVRRVCNLFAKEDWRAALRDEVSPIRPEVAAVIEARLTARDVVARPGPGALASTT